MRGLSAETDPSSGLAVASRRAHPRPSSARSRRGCTGTRSGHDDAKKLSLPCRFPLPSFVLNPNSHSRRHGEHHDRHRRDPSGLEAGTLDRPHPQRSRHRVPDDRRRHQAGAVAGRHRNHGQDGLWFERNAGAEPRPHHHRLHRALFDSADLDPRRDPAHRLSRRRDGLACADRQPPVHAHAVRALSRPDGVGRAVAARPEFAQP